MEGQHLVDRLIDYMDGDVEEKELLLIEHHLKTCAACANELAALQSTDGMMKGLAEERPDEHARIQFLARIEQEKNHLVNPSTPVRSIDAAKDILPVLFRVAAVIALMVCSYLLGSYQTENTNLKEMVSLQKEQSKLKDEVTLALIGHSSASQRLLAMNYAEVIEQPNSSILDAIISKMRNDNYVSVRMAAVQALAKFDETEMVRHALIEALKVETDPSMQIELIQVLVDLQEKRAIPVIQKLLKEKLTPDYLKEQIKTELLHLV